MTAPAALAILAACGWTAGVPDPASPQDAVANLTQGGSRVELAAPGSALLGEPVTVRATARLGAGETIALDLERSTTESFAITEVRELPAPAPVERRFDIQVVPLDVGRRSFPLYWTLTGPGAARMLTAEFQIEVREPPQAAQARDVKDIKPPRRARPALWPWLLAAALLGLWYWNERRTMRRRELAAAAGLKPDTRPPEVIAEDELARLESSGLWEQGRPKEFYGALTDILRRYLERRFAFPATGETTTEIYRRLRRLALDRQLLTLFKALFERADLVKFAKIPAQDQWGATDLAAARRLVRETTRKGSAPGEAKP